MTKSNGGLSDLSDMNQLDKLAIMGKTSVEACLALGVELFMAPPGKDNIFQLYSDLLECFEEYYENFHNKLNCYGLPNASRLSKIKDNPVPRWKKAVEKLDGTYGMGMEVFYDDTHEGVAFNATPWIISSMGGKLASSYLSALTASMQIGSNNEEGNNFSTLFSLVLSWCEKLKPAHGSAGFCFAYTPGMEAQSKWTWPLLQRYPGIDHHDVVRFSLAAEDTYNRIKGVNWLTILGNNIVAELGGIAEIKMHLGEQCRIHPYDGGVIIIAGPNPQLGDNYAGIIPERYKAVAKLTRPVRFENYEYPLLKLPEPIDRTEATLKWIRRFD
ncbi:type VI immunity family protein [Buttiauxella agrestis]